MGPFHHIFRPVEVTGGCREGDKSSWGGASQNLPWKKSFSGCKLHRRAALAWGKAEWCTAWRRSPGLSWEGSLGFQRARDTAHVQRAICNSGYKSPPQPLTIASNINKRTFWSPLYTYIKSWNGLKCLHISMHISIQHYTCQKPK